MASPAKHGVRLKRAEVHVSEFSIDMADATTSLQEFQFNLPPGGYNILASIWATDLSATAIIKIHPYVDHEQTLTDGANKFLQAGQTTATTNITVEASTATAKGYSRAVIQSGDQYGLAAPVLSLHGALMTVNCTAATGIINFGSVSMEI